jgi:hypothetical protein
MKKFSDQKSNLRVVVKSTSPLVRRRLKAKCQRDGPPEEYGVQDLKKTALEKRIIRRGIKIFQEIIEDLGLNIKFCPDLKYFHVITKKEMCRKLHEHTPTNAYFNCHAYLLRDRSPWFFIHSVTHELAHFVSYYQLSIVQGKDGKPRYYRLTNGFSDDKNSRLIFNGFDEAVTEILAIEARRRFVARSKILTPQKKKELKSLLGYEYQMIFTEELLLKATDNKKKLAALKKEVFRAYILGRRDQLFKKLKLDQKTIRVLKKMTTTKVAVNRALAKLGWEFVIA